MISFVDMIKSKYSIIVFIFHLFLTITVFNDANNINVSNRKVNNPANYLYEGSGIRGTNATTYLPSRSDDEDSVTGVVTPGQSSGDGPIHPPDAYPILDPYTRTRSTATILVDVAFEHSYKSYMLPGSSMTPQLRSFQNEIIDNFKLELQKINVHLEYNIISLRPGPLIPKTKPMRTGETHVPSVFVRMNITQFNSSIFNPLLLFQISHCGRQGVLGNLTISEQIVFPQYVCTNKQVYCLPECRNGAYCDGITDCHDTNLDEPASCPKCLYKHVNLVSNTNIVDDDEDLVFQCQFNEKCKDIKRKIRWSFPVKLKSYEEFYKGNEKVQNLPKDLIASGIYRCIIDGESSKKNISVFKKPIVLVTKADPDADTVIISETEGDGVDYWCNSTSGIARWMPVDTNGVKISNHNERSAKLSFGELTKKMTNVYHCTVEWGYTKSRIIKKTVKLIVLCDVKRHFECRQQQSKRSCIPINQKCDSIKQCDDGSDEDDCVVCPEKELSIDLGQRIVRDVGDTVIMECQTTKTACRPISWWTRGHRLTTGGNIVFFKFSLFIVNMSVYNSGLYQCADASNKTSVSIFVHVNAGPTLRLSPKISTLNITHGNSASVLCMVDYPLNVTYPKQKPNWVKVNENQLPRGIEVISNDDTNSKIVFSKTQLSMSGVYQCEVAWGTTNDKVVRKSVMVNINPLVCKMGERKCADNTMCLAASLWCDGRTQCADGSDERQCDKCSNGFVFVQPAAVTVLVGQTVEIHCYYDKDCYPVKWRTLANNNSNNRALNSVNNLVIQNNKLIIHNIGVESSNIYECYSGDKRSQSNVTVIRQVELKVSRDYAFIDYGQNVTVDCQSNFGQPQWRRRDLKSLSAVNGAHQSNLSPNTAKLVLNSPSYDANGYYVCFVRLSQSDEEAANSLMFVHVNDLKCLPGYLICDGKTKCIPKNKLCDSINDCKNGEDEKMCPKCNEDLGIKPADLTITTFGYGVLECIVPNKECMPIEWRSKNNNALTSPRFYKYLNYLYIFSPRLSDADEIMCTSGHKSASARLTVKNLQLTLDPNQYDDSTIYMLSGQSKKITCRSNVGTPVWIYPEESSVFQYGVSYISDKDDSAVLNIVNVQKAASHKYVCQVSFSRENKKISISINVI